MPNSNRPANAGTNARTGYGAVFAVREFRPVFAAHVLSMLGGVVAEVALSVLVFRPACAVRTASASTSGSSPSCRTTCAGGR